MIKFLIRDSGPRELSRVIRNLRKATGKALYAGLPNEGPAARQHDSESGLTVVEIALVNEYGSSDGRIPSRPAVRTAMADTGNQQRLADQFAADFSPLLAGELTPDQVFARTGLLAVAMIQKSMTDWSEPPNAPATIKRKGVNNPLIDEGIVRRSITFVIRPESGDGAANV